MGPMRFPRAKPGAKAATIALACLAAACSSEPRIVVVNAGGLPLEAVVVSGSGFEQALGDLAPGARVATRVHPAGDSGLSIAFVRDGARVVHGPDGYFEASGGYEVVATVRADGSVEVASGL